MAFHLQLIIFTFISVVAGGSRHAAILTPQEAYWKSILPNTTMPHTISDLLPSSDYYTVLGKEMLCTEATIGKSSKRDVKGYWCYACAASDEELSDNTTATLFFLKTAMQEGTKMSLRLTTSTSPATFLPRQVADSIPFSSNKLPQILNRLSLKPDTPAARIVEDTIKGCTSTGKLQGEENYCVTSLESMIDFSVSKLGKEVVALSTELNITSHPSKNERFEKRYTITGVRKFVVERSVVCHKQNYAYAVFYCHGTSDSEVYMVSLLSVDGDGGIKANAVAVCHMNTTAWNPKHLAFQVLKVKPGTTPICHFLSEDIVAWVPYPYLV